MTILSDLEVCCTMCVVFDYQVDTFPIPGLQTLSGGLSEGEGARITCETYNSENLLWLNKMAIGKFVALCEAPGS